MRKSWSSLKQTGLCLVKQQSGRLKKLANSIKMLKLYLWTSMEQESKTSYDDTKYDSSQHFSTLIRESLYEDSMESAPRLNYEESSIRNNTMMVNVPPAFSLLKYIYRGPHLDDDGRLDDRIWFSIMVALDPSDETYTFMVFPHGAKQDELKEVYFNKKDLVWID